MPIVAINEKNNSSILTDAKKEAFFAALADCGSVVGACSASGLNRWFIYGQRGKDKDFAERWNMALQLYADKLDMELHNRAVVGEQEPIWYKDETGKPAIVGYRTKKSDSLFHVSLQANNPAKYSRKLEVAGSIQHNHKAELPEAVLSILDSLKAVNVTPLPCPDPAVIECQEHQPGEFGAIPENTFGAIQCDSIATLPEVGAINSEVWRDPGAIQEGSLRDSGAIIGHEPEASDPQSDHGQGDPAGWKVRKVEAPQQSHQATVKVHRYAVE